MKKIVVIMMILIIPLITVEKVNNKNYYLETETNTYTKAEIDNKINELLTKINDNTTKITETKSILTDIKNKLDDYALKTELTKTNENITTLDELANQNKAMIDELEILYNQGTATSEDIIVGKTAIVNGKLITGNLETTGGTLNFKKIGDYNAKSYEMSTGDNYARSYFDLSSLQSYIDDGKYSLYAAPRLLANIKNMNDAPLGLTKITAVSSNWQVAIWSHSGTTGYSVTSISVYAFWIE